MFVLFLVMHLCMSQQMAKSQNYIGMHKDAIATEMKASYKQFKLNRGTINPHYNYLKYENVIDEITLLFFLSEKDICTMVRMICDYANINEVPAMLDEKYKSTGKDEWIDTKKDKSYAIKLTEEEWFFTVSFKEKE